MRIRESRGQIRFKRKRNRTYIHMTVEGERFKELVMNKYVCVVCK